MKIAHFVYYGPKQCGLYETTREITKGEIDLGHDARMVDTSWMQKKTPAPETSILDRGVEIAPMDWAEGADIHVLHSIIPPQLYGKKPIVVVAHGAPEYVFYSELLNHEKGDRGYSTLLTYSHDKGNVRKFVTLWERHLPFWQAAFGDDRVMYIPSCADLREYTPAGDVHQFKKDGCPNIGFCDTWRPTFFKDPFQILVGIREYWKKYPESRMQLFAIPGGKKRDMVWDRYIKAVQAQGDFIGDIWELNQDMPKVYRALDMVITTTVDASRIVRECLASGTPLIAPPANPYTPYKADLMEPKQVITAIEQCMQDLERDAEAVTRRCVETAKANFSVEDTGEAFIKLYEEVLGGSDAGSVKHEQAPETSSAGVHGEDR